MQKFQIVKRWMRVTRNIQAQEAFNERDAEASSKFHLSKHAKENHVNQAGDYVKSIVFGGLDGIVTTYAVLVASVASGEIYSAIIIITFANLIGDAIGMALGDFLSSLAEVDHAKAEHQRETWEVENVPDTEKREMYRFYKGKGFSDEDAHEVVDLLFQSKTAFIDIMMMEELGLMREENEAIWKGSLATFFSFMLLGGIPMLPYLFSGDYSTKGEVDPVFGVSLVLFFIVLYTLGGFKGVITGKKWYKTGLTMLLTGTVTTGSAYAVGWGIEQATKNLK